MPIYNDQFILPAVLEGRCAKPDCINHMGLRKGSLVVSTLVGIYHTPCLPREMEDSTGCWQCGERHPQPYDGSCLL